MPAKSKSQQRFMGMVRAVQKGEMEAPSKEVADAAKSMSKSDAKDYAETKHKGLPEKKEEKEASASPKLSVDDMIDQARNDKHTAEVRKTLFSPNSDEDLSEEDIKSIGARATISKEAAYLGYTQGQSAVYGFIKGYLAGGIGEKR